MNLIIIGGDQRMLYTAEYLHKKGCKPRLYGLDSDSFETTLCEAIASADAVILPLPVSGDDLTVRAPLSNKTIYLDDIILCKPKMVFGGMISDHLKLKLKEKAIPFYDYYQSESLTVKNALLTAEAAISIAIDKTDFSLFGAKVLVIGYGRIGKILSKYLKALGADVTATSRDNGTLALIETDGYSALNTADIYNTLQNYDFVFNTVPAPVMNRLFFGSLKDSCYVSDLATSAGTDTQAAEEYNIKLQILPGLPGKLFPKTAGELIGNEILNHLTSERQK